jgi:hypothetical protein
MSTKMQVEWRRAKVLELLSMGNSQTEIAKTLQIDLSTINRDISFLRQRARDNIRKYIDERLPEEYEKCLVGLNSIVKEAWTTSQQTQDRREKIQALSLAKECYAMKLELLTNATVVGDAIKFVTSNTNNNTRCEAVKPKADACILDSTEDHDIQRPEEETEHRAGEPTTNSVF